MRLRGLKFRKPWYTPPTSFPFELEITVPPDIDECHMLARDTLTWTFVGHPVVSGFTMTATRQLSLHSGDELTVRGQVEGIDCRFMRGQVDGYNPRYDRDP